MTDTEQLIHDLKQLGRYSDLEPNYWLLAVEKIEELSGKQIKTNYDRIRNMSVEEMAEFILMMAIGYCSGQVPKNIKEWLESEVDAE